MLYVLTPCPGKVPGICRVRLELERLELPPQLLPGLNSGGVRSSSPGDLIQLLLRLDLNKENSNCKVIEIR